MTRFARAKGAKASNERVPEESTPWEVMKEQLLNAKKETEEAKKRQEAEQQRITNYENFLQERKLQKHKAEWCDFPEVQIQKPTNNASDKPLKKGKNEARDSLIMPDDKGTHNEDTSNKQKKKKKKLEMLSTDDNKNSEVLKKKKKNKKSESHLDTNAHKISIMNTSSSYEAKDQSEKSNNCLESSNDLTATTSLPSAKESNSFNENAKGKHNNSSKKKQKQLSRDPKRRKEINDNSFQLIINGKEVELVRFDGFPIMKKDAERLADLKNSMIKKGIPKSEVQRTMKLERRRAEKALARVKREVCYNCRKGGHNLSDCPDLKSKIPGAEADGICFKCGSTEHRQFECKVQKEKEFRFATCFICKEPGHIARQCPDNPKGLYPNGGSCKLCGDVTHLRKDCPTANNEKESSSIKLPTLDGGDNIEEINEKSKNSVSNVSAKKPKKIKF